MGTGGISIQADGTEAPLSEEELQERLNMPDVEYEEDESVWVYYQNQKLEITDKFTDGVCYVKLEGKDKTLYICKTEKRPYQHLCWHGRKSFKACFTAPFLSLYQKRRVILWFFDRLRKTPVLLAPEPFLRLTLQAQRK